MTGRVERRFPQMPIAGQLLILLMGVLVIAQGATLLLTLAFPPQPPPLHRLEDIARAIRGEEIRADGARPLLREIVDAPPRPEGPGWLTTTGPRDQLAILLGAQPSDVVLMFYVPLPTGTQLISPLPAEDRGGPDRSPTIIAASFVPTGAINSVLTRALSPPPASQRPGPDVVGAQSDGGFPADGFRRELRGSDNAWPRTPRAETPPSNGDAQRPRSWTNPAHPAPRIEDRAQSYGPPAALTGGVFSGTRSSSVGKVWPSPVGLPAEEPGSSRPFLPNLPGGTAPPPDAPEAGAPVRIGSGPWPLPLGRLRWRSPVVVLTETASRSASPGRSSESAPVPPFPAATQRSPLSIAIRPNTPVENPPSEVADTVADDTSVVARDVAPAAEATALLAFIEPADSSRAPVRRGLFAPVPTGHIEGDFVAAHRIGLDRWVVVKPKPQGFPNAWQSRVTLWFLLAFALVAPIGWLFARRITAPLRSFAEAAERLGRDPTALANVQGGSAELGLAATTFNQMQTRLKRYVEDRTAMIRAISHDLRTPLARMRFRLDSAPSALRPGFEKDIAQMEAMISSVLTFMRDQNEAGERRRVDLRALLKEAVDNAVAGGADVAIEPGETIQVEADIVALNRVFANLLDNAVKYGGRAVVHLDRDGSEAVAAVRDFGPGLPESELERVFKPFYRTAEASAGPAPGMGLGLANTRSIVLAHGGTIHLRSDEGLTAEVRLPLAA